MPRSCSLKQLVVAILVFALVFLLSQIVEFASVNHVVNQSNHVIVRIKSKRFLWRNDTEYKSPRLLLIVSYQRTGSTLFGGLFDRNVGDFYVFEPLDSLYSAMYGVREGWSVPADIRNLPNGTQRNIPLNEQRAIAKHINNIFSCDFDRMPSQFVFRQFWDQFAVDQTKLKPFTDCLREEKLLNSHQSCQGRIQKYCPKRFGIERHKEETCHGALWNTESNAPFDEINIEKHKRFSEFARCTNLNRIRGKGCVATLTNLCKSSQLRSVKTVRATMDSVEELVKTNRDLRVIHVFRDPRAVVVSRRNYWNSGRSLYAAKDVVKEAMMLCANLARDVIMRRELETKYPGIFMEVFYDDFVLDPVKVSGDVFRFLNLTLTPNVVDWVLNSTRITKDSLKIASKWRGQIGPNELKGVNEVCSDFFELVPHGW